MKDDYKNAKKKADKEVRESIKQGQSPYLPVLDTIEEVKYAAGQRSLGLLELPISRIKGNKEFGRNNAFARNFMPLCEESSEFARKWSDLYDSYKTEGIRDAIKVYEYMNQYYVQEGNKRVSVSKFGGTEYILADVTRIIPAKTEDPEVVAYYEYMEFYKLTKIFLIVFTEPGEYEKLAELLGQNLVDPWPSDLCLDLKSAFYRFSKILGREFKIEDEFALSNAFLMYLSLFPLKTFDKDSDAQILKNIRLARYELLAQRGEEGVEFLNETPTEARQGSIMSLFVRDKKYTAQSPLKVGFIYIGDTVSSRWNDSHEAGRVYVDAMNTGNVATSAYFIREGDNTPDTLDKAVADGNEIIFATSPEMILDVLRAAVRHPNVKFLNCSYGKNNPSIRCYQGKLYEASFLMGVYTADLLLLDRAAGSDRKIGYVVRSSSRSARANLNAFAVGVSLIDPECKVIVRKANDEYDRSIWENEGITFFADMDYTLSDAPDIRPGIYKIQEGRVVNMGTAYYNWGKYYLQIVNSVLNGTWSVNEMIDRHSATNYWFGLSTGVVDVRLRDIPYQTEKMLTFFRDSITGGRLDPFTGKICTRDGDMLDPGSSPSDRIATKWINENIDGDI